MNKYSHKVFLCGHFSYDKGNVEALSGWERLYSDENAKESYSQLFYPEFVKAYLPSEESAHMRHYRLVVGEKVSLELQGAMHELHVKVFVEGAVFDMYSEGEVVVTAGLDHVFITEGACSGVICNPFVVCR